MRGVVCAPVVNPPDRTTGTLVLRFAPDAGPFTAPVAIRAQARVERNLPVVESDLTVISSGED